MTTTRFGEMASQFEVVMKKVLAMPPAEAPLFRPQAFQYFAAQVLDWFETHPGLTHVGISHFIDVVARGSFNVTIETTHQVRLVARDSGLNEAFSQAEQATLVSKLLPVRLLGVGAFDLERDSNDVKSFLALNANDVEGWQGIVAGISSRMDRKFGVVRYTHAVNEDNSLNVRS